MKASRNETHQQAPYPLDEVENWFPENLARINRKLETMPIGNAASKPVAVFDFDNTCVFRDVGQAVFRYQLQQLRYRIAPQQLASILPVLEGELAGRSIKAVTSALMYTYCRLWPLISNQEIEKARLLPEYRLFAALLLWFTDKARRDERLGPRYVLPFMGKMLAGYSRAELRQLAAEVVTAAMAEPLTEETLAVDAPEPIGRIEAGFPLGLQAYQEIKTLMQRLQRRGIDCYVISASTEWLVEEAVRLLGFPVAADHIFGVRVGLDGQDQLTTADPDAYPLTFREGKAEIIRRFIGATPLLVAGDADTDFEMLTLPEVEIRLLINRNQTGLISTLYQDPRILLQGLDLRTGRFRPSRESLA
jgi:phosphoserine phosphatase